MDPGQCKTLQVCDVIISKSSYYYDTIILYCIGVIVCYNVS